MSTYKINILFFISATRINKRGLVPLICRLTFNGKRKQFSTGLFINPDYWNSKKQKAHPTNKENDFINTQISLIKQKINQAFLFLQVNNENYDVEDIYLQYKGENSKKDKTVLEVFKAHNEKVEKLIGKDYVKPTLWKYNQAMALLKEFIKYKYKKNDYQFKDLDIGFIKDYEFYLKTEKNLAQSSIYKAVQRFKRIVKIAIVDGYLDKDPFLMHKIKSPKTKVVYLTTEELNDLENHTFRQERLQQVQDMFIFCCYTGLAFKEMENLKQEHIVIGFDGNKWLNMERRKTDKVISVPLLSKALQILEKYQENENRVFPKISNQKFNSYIKEIAEVVGIEKKISHHIARKTFATTVLLYNDVPMEIVSELLGHSKITITQDHYAKVVQKKVSEQMKKLGKKIK